MAELVCRDCGKVFDSDRPLWRCRGGGLFDLEVDASFPIERIESRKNTIWRYREALPIEDDSNIVSFGEGFTPLEEMDIGGDSVLMKQDHLFPTGSYKDRGASILVSKIKGLGLQKVVEDSSGNAGAAVACYCSKADIGCEICVPGSTPPGKTAQIESYGAELNRVDGDREETAKVALEKAEESYYASHSWNPFFFHGTKTFAFEVCEQLGWESPDSVVLPVGNGTLLLGAWKGFLELEEAGVIDGKPKMVGVQTEECAPLYNKSREDEPRNDDKTPIAEGIAISDPVRKEQILDAVEGSGGRFLAVSREETVGALENLCRRGYYVEPTSAATVAGLDHHVDLEGSETIVSSLTGHGLKASDKIRKLISGP